MFSKIVPILKKLLPNVPAQDCQIERPGWKPHPSNCFLVMNEWPAAQIPLQVGMSLSRCFIYSLGIGIIRAALFVCVSISLKACLATYFRESATWTHTSKFLIENLPWICAL